MPGEETENIEAGYISRSFGRGTGHQFKGLLSAVLNSINFVVLIRPYYATRAHQ